MTKTIKITFALLLCSGLTSYVSGQSLISSSGGSFYENSDSRQFQVNGSNTSFNTGTPSLSVFLNQGTDTIHMIGAVQVFSNSALRDSIPSVPLSTKPYGFYDVNVLSSIDGLLKLPNAVKLLKAKLVFDDYWLPKIANLSKLQRINKRYHYTQITANGYYLAAGNPTINVDLRAYFVNQLDTIDYDIGSAPNGFLIGTFDTRSDSKVGFYDLHVTSPALGLITLDSVFEILPAKIDLVSPQKVHRGATTQMNISGAGTDFMAGSPTLQVFAEKGGITLPFTQPVVTGKETIVSPISLSGSASLGWYDVITVDTAHDTLTKINAFQVVPYSISGMMFYDQDGNGVKNGNEFGLTGMKVQLLPDSTVIFSDNLGNYSFGADTGNFVVTPLLDTSTGLMPNPISKNVSVTNGSSFGNDFAVNLTGTLPPTDINLGVTVSIFRCNRTSQFFLNFQNTGALPINGKAYMLPDTSFTLDTIVPYFPNSSLGDTLVIDSINLQPLQSKLIKLNFDLPGINILPVGSMSNYWLQFVASDPAMSAYDTVVVVDSALVRCSYDPNDKLVSPAGQGENGCILKNTDLTYTVRFQNTGNDTAFDIRIEDTLSSNLDFSSFQVLSSSHNVSTAITRDGNVEFKFDNIMLPDSGTNEPLSNGYVKYSIAQKKDLVDSSTIKNTAFIYFDFNPPIITNTTLNTVVTSKPALGLEETNIGTFRVYPNPTTGVVNINFPKGGGVSDLIIMDVAGRIVHHEISPENIVTINISDSQSGLYLVRAVINGNQVTEKLFLF